MTKRTRGQKRNLTDEEVKRIRKDPRPLKDIAKEFGVTCPAIVHIREGRSYKHVQ
jgi:hypothetical protein